jgi:UDP:flavonoid glycosyltransferase YjiC (YdhE family)
MRVLLSAYGSRGDVEPMVGFAVRLQRTYYAGVGALLPQSGVQGCPFARGR